MTLAVHPVLRPRMTPRTITAILALALTSALIAWTPGGTADSVVDSGTASLGTWLARAVSALSWPVLVGLVTASVLHYTAAAVAARAACHAPLPFPELVIAQFAAAAANRVTPAGLGGAAVLGRYYIRRGHLRSAESAGVITTLTVAGSVADVLAFGLLVGSSVLLGSAGARAEVPLLLGRLTDLVPLPTGAWGWTATGAVLVTIAAAWALRPRRGATAQRIRNCGRSYACALAAAARRPRHLATMMVASGSTTIALAAGFAYIATAGSDVLPTSAFAALMIGYMVAAAAGNALPTPGGIGTAEAALVGVLVADRVPAASALAIVLAFRLVTFWSPAVIGAFALRHLRRNGAL